jgi:hypothetical protein
MAADGTFRTNSSNVLSPNQFLPDEVLNDRQQRRQELYRRYLQWPRTTPPNARPVLLAWAEPIDMHFNLARDPRLAGEALLAVPLRLERSAPGTDVTIPGPLLPYRRVLEGRPVVPILDSLYAADMHLRFDIPAEVQPFQLQRARLTARISAPSRRVIIGGWQDGKLKELKRVNSPLDPIRIDISDPALLRPDQHGVYLNVSISAPSVSRASKEEDKWKIEYLELEISGRVAAR